jgi:hypothetical protein
VFAHRVSKFVKQLECVHVLKILLESTLCLLDQLISIQLSIEAQIEVDQLEVQLVELQCDTLPVILTDLGSRQCGLLRLQLAQDHACVLKYIYCVLRSLCLLVGIS